MGDTDVYSGGIRSCDGSQSGCCLWHSMGIRGCMSLEGGWLSWVICDEPEYILDSIS